MDTTKQTFTKRVKEDLILNEYELEQKRAMLAGYIRIVGSISILPSFSLRLSSSSAIIAKFMYSCLKEIYQVSPSFNYTKQLRLNKNTIYHIEVNEKVEYILKDLEISDGLTSIKATSLVNDKHLPFYIAGLFLACGQVSDPMGSSYYCEMSFDDEKEAKQILNKLTNFKASETMKFKMIKRRNKFVLYLKRSDQISVFLSFIGATNMMLDFENSRLEKDYFNNENRLTICEQANYSRALKNGEENIADIEYLKKNIGSSYFNEKATLLAELRLENKDASYQEIASLAEEKGLYISKSGVAHIFKKFSDDAKKYGRQ